MEMAETTDSVDAASDPEERRRRAILDFAAFDRRKHREVYDALAGE